MTHVDEVFHILCSSQRLFDALLVNTKEMIWVKATCGIRCWNCDFFFATKKEKLIPNSLPCLLCSTQSGRSCLSHSFPVILCGIYSPAAILVFLLVPKIPNMPDLCIVHSLPLLRSLLQCYQRPFLTTLSDIIPPQCVLLSSLSLCYFFLYQLLQTDSHLLMCELSFHHQNVNCKRAGTSPWLPGSGIQPVT